VTSQSYSEVSGTSGKAHLAKAAVIPRAAPENALQSSRSPEGKKKSRGRKFGSTWRNAITTDFWKNLDGITGAKEWQMHGTGGDAKGQPTQTNSISHGSPWLCIRKINVGAAFD
jgi:hypothetical protein